MIPELAPLPRPVALIPLGAKAAVILGEDEFAKGIATIKDLESGQQVQVSL